MDTSKNVLTMAQAYKVMAQSLGISLDAATKLLNALFNNRDTSEFAKMIIKAANDPSHSENDSLYSREVHPEVIKELKGILDRDKDISAMVIGFDTEKDSGKQNSVLYFGSQREKVNLALSEAMARAGVLKEIDRDVAEHYIGKLADNPMREVKDISKESYQRMLTDIAKLDYPMNRITLFPKYYEKDGRERVDVGFLDHTPERTLNKDGEIKKMGPYSIPDVVRTMLFKQEVMERTDYLDKCAELNDMRTTHRESVLRGIDYEKMEKDSKELASVRRTINASKDMPQERKTELNRLLRTAEYTKGREQLIEELKKDQYLSEPLKNKMIERVNSLQEPKYLVPVKMDREGKDLTLEMDRDQYVRLGTYAMVVDGKDHISANAKAEPGTKSKAENEIDYFTKTHFRDDQAFVIVGEKEMERLKKKEKLKLKDLKELTGTEQALFTAKNEVGKLEKAPDNIIEIVNENKDSYTLIAPADQIQFEGEVITAGELVKDLLCNNSEMIIDGDDSYTIIGDSIDEIDNNYAFETVKDPYFVDDVLQEEEPEDLVPDIDPHAYKDFEQPTPNTFDVNHNGIDDRDEVF